VLKREGILYSSTLLSREYAVIQSLILFVSHLFLCIVDVCKDVCAQSYSLQIHVFEKSVRVGMKE
jgi:hypothetical protein